MNDLTVVCVWVRGHVPYTAEYVTKLGRMVRRHLKLQHRFVCLTDRPKELPRADVLAIEIKPLDVNFAWWNKVRLFEYGLVPGDRILYLDLDTLPVGDLSDVVDYPAKFALAPHAGNFHGRNGLQTVHRFNSSVMVWDRNEPLQLWDLWDTEVPTKLWGDQDWIGQQMPKAVAMPEEWFPRLSQLGGERPDGDARVVLCKVPKNAEAAKQHAWVRDTWR